MTNEKWNVKDILELFLGCLAIIWSVIMLTI